MAIDVYTVKPPVAGDGKFQSAKEPAGNSGINFAELMRNNGLRVSSGLLAISDRAGITSIGDKADKATAAFTDRQRDPVGDSGKRYDDSRYDTDQASVQDSPPHTDQHDDYTRAQTPQKDTGYSEQTAERSPERNPGRNNEATTGQHDNSTGYEATDQPSSPQGNTKMGVETENGQTTEQSAASGKKSAKQSANGGNNAEQILQSLLASAQASTQPAVVTDHAAQKGGPSENAVSGLTNAPAKNTKNPDTAAAQNVVNGGVGSKANTGANANTNDGFNLHANQAAQAKTGTTGQSQNTAGNVQNQTVVADAARNETVAQQSAQLSKMVGNGAKIAVSVNTTREATTIVSKPSTSLTSGAALVGQSNAQNGRGHQSQNSVTATAGQNPNTAAQVQANAGQSQGTVIQVAAQNSANSTPGGDLKNPIQATQNIGAPQSVAAGAGVTAPGAVNVTHQVQHKTSAQASNAPRFALPGQAVTDQVTVQITKAFNAGTDKISIHLKPADLGRVDVKLEVGHDGRVTAIVTADNKSTLDLLQKDSKELQQALQDAGLQMDNDSLSFNLRERNEQGEEFNTAGSNLGENGDDDTDASENSNGDQLAVHNRNIISDTRVDIRA